MKITQAQQLAATVLTSMLAPEVLADALGDTHMGTDWGWSHMFYGAPMMLIFWLLILVFIVIVARWMPGLLPGIRSKQAVAPALQILAERFARGEIDKTEFNDRKREITS